MFKKVLHHFVGFAQDEDQVQTVREIFILDTNEVYYRSNDIDGETRYYTSSIPDFENEFKVNIGEMICF